MPDSEHVERICEALAEINHLDYVEVEALEDGVADVRVRNADRMENALVNNGEFAAFHDAGYVGHHADYDEEFIDLRKLDGDSDA